MLSQSLSSLGKTKRGKDSENSSCQNPLETCIVPSARCAVVFSPGVLVGASLPSALVQGCCFQELIVTSRFYSRAFGRK